MLGQIHAPPAFLPSPHPTEAEKYSISDNRPFREQPRQLGLVHAALLARLGQHAVGEAVEGGILAAPPSAPPP